MATCCFWWVLGAWGVMARGWWMDGLMDGVDPLGRMWCGMGRSSKGDAYRYVLKFWALL